MTTTQTPAGAPVTDPFAVTGEASPKATWDALESTPAPARVLPPVPARVLDILREVIAHGPRYVPVTGFDEKQTAAVRDAFKTAGLHLGRRVKIVDTKDDQARDCLHISVYAETKPAAVTDDPK